MWDLKVIDVNKPLYIAIADALERDILDGRLRPGDKVPTHRELARVVGVTVTTVTRAYKEAERRGLITATVGSGTFVTSDLGSNSSLVNTESRDNRLIEMGLVFPLSHLDERIKDVIQTVTRKNHLSDFMDYVPPQGLLRHCQVGAEWVKRFGIEARAENVLVTCGAQHAINCIFTSVFEPGDKVAVDYLTYPGVKSAARRCGIRLEGVLMDSEGMMPDELDSLCHRQKIKGLYTVGSMHNPTNACMPEQRKKDIARIIRKHNLILVEDDLYGFLSDGRDTALTPYAPEHSIYVAGLSKTFYAGLRIGFMVTPQRFFNRIAQAIIDTIWMVSPLCAEIAGVCITSGVADHIIAAKKQEMDERAALLGEKFKKYLYHYTPHNMFAWFELPPYWSSGYFEKAASSSGINVVSSDKFIVGSVALPNAVRLSLSGVNSRQAFITGLTIFEQVLTRRTGGVMGQN